MYWKKRNLDEGLEMLAEFSEKNAALAIFSKRTKLYGALPHIYIPFAVGERRTRR